MTGELPLIFVAGLAGSMHCLGMCGGLACGLGADPRGGVATARRHLLYNLGRIGTYCFVGAVVGHLGAMFVGHAGEGTAASLAQRALALVSGVLMLVVGLQFLGWLGHFGGARPERGGAWLVGALRNLLRAPGIGAPLALGVFNGLLPCPLVYAFAAQAAASGGALPGLLTMAAFGLGTLPMMLAAGGLGGLLWAPQRADGSASVVRLVPRRAAAGPWRDRRVLGVRIAGAFIVALAFVTIARGLLTMGAHLHGA